MNSSEIFLAQAESETENHGLRPVGIYYNQCMYPAQTSLIPAQIALARFWEEGCNIFGPYPYWYLGTTPYRYLTGPILPLALTALHKFLPQFSLFEIILGLIGIGWLFGGLGLYFLVKEWKGREVKRIAFLTAFFYLFGPLVPFLFRFSDGLSLLSFSFFPWGLVFYLRMVRSFSLKTALGFGGTAGFLFLLNMAVVPSFLLSLAVVFLTQVGWKKTEEKLKQILLVLGLAFLGATIWYTPGFWRVSLFGPSLAGKPRLEVLFQLSKLLPIAFGLAAAAASVKFFKKKNPLRDFCFYWLFVFGFLTAIRLISDPDFYLDWLSYFWELQLGLAVLVGLIVNRFLSTRGLKSEAEPTRLNWLKPLVFYSLLFVFWTFLVRKYVFQTFQPEIEKTVEYQIGEELSKMVDPKETVFLSGSTVFWLNAFFDIRQVRGGRDQVSVHSTWRKAVWEIREGREAEKSIDWFKDLGVAWLVVHDSQSKEYYHDFTYPEKFDQTKFLEGIVDYSGDKIYRVLN